MVKLAVYQSPWRSYERAERWTVVASGGHCSLAPSYKQPGYEATVAQTCHALANVMQNCQRQLRGREGSQHLFYILLLNSQVCSKCKNTNILIHVQYMSGITTLVYSCFHSQLSSSSSSGSRHWFMGWYGGHSSFLRPTGWSGMGS